MTEPDDKKYDFEAKGIMRGWPRATEVLFGGKPGDPWLRAQPKNSDDKATAPYLLTAGATGLRTQPDGMYVRSVDDFRAMDVVCFEVCSSLANLQDKRSRYSPATSSLVVDIRGSWWKEPLNGAGTRKTRLEAVYAVEDEGHYADDWFPVRYLRVVFVLSKKNMELVNRHGVAAGHEYFIRNSSMASMTNAKFRDFLKRLSPQNHFYTR